jgi:hypothetical protein
MVAKLSGVPVAAAMAKIVYDEPSWPIFIKGGATGI